MSKRLIVVGGVFAVIVVAVLVLGLVLGPRLGFWPMGYAAGRGMHRGVPGYAMHRALGRGGLPFLWGGGLMLGVVRLGGWLLQIALTAGLVAWLLRRSAPDRPSGPPQA